MILGVANVVPGVSGGTMAVVFNIYDRIIGIITPNVRKIASEWRFILPLAIGMVLGVVLFSKAITFLFENYPVQTNWFFIGIILGSIPMILRRLVMASRKGGGGKAGAKACPVPVSAIVCGVVALAVMALMTYLEVSDAGAPIQTELTPLLAVRLVVGLACATIAMIIPGISGSFLMLVVGIYSTVIAAISDLNIPLLVPAVIGGVVGLLGGAKLVRVLMARVPAQTYGAILGLVLGSILVVFPGFGGGALVLLSSLGCAALGFVVSFFAGREKIEGAED